MTVQSDLEKAITAATIAKGTYLMAADSTQDEYARFKYNDMAKDVDIHLAYLKERQTYLIDLAIHTELEGY